MLYKPFRHIARDIGNYAEEFIRNWQAFRPFYEPWHQHRTLSDIDPLANDNSNIHEFHPPDIMDLNEWELLSQLYPTDELLINDLQMLGLRGFDENHNWNHTAIPLHLQEIGPQFIENNHSVHRIIQTNIDILTYLNSLSPMKKKRSEYYFYSLQ